MRPWLTLVLLLAMLPFGALAVAQEADNADDMAARRQEAIEQLKRIGIALHNCHDKQNSFPAPFISQEGKATLSWRVAILQFLEDPAAQALYQEFHLDEPWDSDHNKPLVLKMPDVYRCPLSKAAEHGRTVYLAPRGLSTVFSGPEGKAARDVPDGLSNTIAIVEADEEHAVEWTRPDDWQFDPADPAAHLGGHIPGHLMFLFADGAVHILRDTVDKGTLKALFTRNGSEIIAVPCQ
jgi:hypothetical protein